MGPLKRIGAACGTERPSIGQTPGIPRLRSPASWLVLIALVGCSSLGPPAASPISTHPASPSPIPTAHPVDPTAPPTALATGMAAECTQPEPEVEAGRYRGVAVPGEVPYLIYLPPCYHDLDRIYPAIYLLHGYPYDERHWLELGALEAADQGRIHSDWPPFLMVMPLQPDPLFRNSDGGPGSYETELLDGIVAYVDRMYRADPSRRGLAGISRGGVWALEVGFRNPSDFQAVAAVGPALAVNSARPPYDPFEIVRTAQSLPAHILLLAGDDDWAAPATERLSTALALGGFAHELVLVPGDHRDATWAAAMPQILGFFAGALAETP